MTERRDQSKQITTAAKPLLRSDVFSIPDLKDQGWTPSNPEALTGFVECVVELDDNRTHMKRVQLGDFANQGDFYAAAQAYGTSIKKKYQAESEGRGTVMSKRETTTDKKKVLDM